MRAASPKTGPCAPVEAPRFRVRAVFSLRKPRVVLTISAYRWMGTTASPSAYSLPETLRRHHGRTPRRRNLLPALARRSGAPDAQCYGHFSAEPLSGLDRDRLDHCTAAGHLLQSPLLPPLLVLPAATPPLV